MRANYALYPQNWLTEIRPLILRRAGERPEKDIEALCEKCGVTNYSLRRTLYPDGWRDIRIVITIAHLDQDIQNNDPTNLAALCQRCHLRWDRPWALINASLTRQRNRRQLMHADVDPNEWRKHMAKKKDAHSFNVLLDEEETSMLSHLAEHEKTNMSIVLRQALRYRFTMTMNKVPTCADGRTCFVPHMHIQAVEPMPPKPVPAIAAETGTAIG